MDLFRQQIDEDLICAQCKRVFESAPLTQVPCGWVVCSKHLNTPMPMCAICPNKHYVIRENCVSTKNIESKYLKYKLEKTLNELEKLLGDFKTIRNDPKDYVNAYYSQIMYKLEQQRSQIKNLIDDHFDKIQNQIKIFRKDFDRKSIDTKKIKKFNLHELESKIKSLSDQLNKFSANGNQPNEVLQKSNQQLDDFKNEIEFLIHEAFNSKLYELNPISSFINCDNLFGKLVIKVNFINIKDIKF